MAGIVAGLSVVVPAHGVLGPGIGQSSATALPVVPTGDRTPSPPRSMAALGDSITRGFNACGFFVDCGRRSWSTGIDSGVRSHYWRLRRHEEEITGSANNYAHSGARSADLLGQVKAAVAEQVEYVTVLIGANDACASTAAAMTPLRTFRAQVRAAFRRLAAGLPAASLFVASIPDLKRLWRIGKDDARARMAWALFDICPSMLDDPRSTDRADRVRRNRVRDRVIAYNGVLARWCAAYDGSCRFDGNAVFDHQFRLSQLSRWDYFHPNAAGQRALARVTYASGFDW